MPDWTPETPLRVVTGYHNIAQRFFEREGFRHVALLSADGALEAAPLMGCADIILDLVRPAPGTAGTRCSALEVCAPCTGATGERCERLS